MRNTSRRRFLQLTASGLAVAVAPAVALAEPRRKVWTGADFTPLDGQHRWAAMESVTREAADAMTDLGVTAEQAAADCEALADHVRRPDVVWTMGDQRFVLEPAEDTIMTSPDGITWTIDQLGPMEQPRAFIRVSRV